MSNGCGTIHAQGRSPPPLEAVLPFCSGYPPAPSYPLAGRRIPPPRVVWLPQKPDGPRLLLVRFTKLAVHKSGSQNTDQSVILRYTRDQTSIQALASRLIIEVTEAHMITIAIQMESAIQWIATETTERNRWVAQCAPLGLALEGDSLDEIHSLIDEASQHLFQDLLEDDELHLFLRERGWKVPRSIPSGDEEIQFQVPWNLVASGGHYDSALGAH